MRILYVMYGFPYPLASGYLRSYFMIKGLAERHQVTLVSVVGADFEEAHRDGLAPFTEQIVTATSTARAPLLHKIVGRVRTLVGGFGADPAIQRLNAEIRQLRAAQEFDLAITGGGRATPLTDSFADLPIIVDLCDADTMRLRESLRYANPTRLPLILLELLQIRELEQQMLADGSHILFAAARDRDALLDERERARTSIVPNGVDCTFWQRTSTERGTDTIVFTGVMDYPPNNDAAHFLIEEIFPLVRQQRPHARLLIVGRNPKEPLQRAGQAEGVTVTGWVEDVRPYLEAATVFAAPLRFGSGIQNKVLEAMAMEVPVVTTPLAADGLRRDNGEAAPLTIAADAPSLAARLVEQLEAGDRSLAPDAHGRRFVMEQFTWEAAMRKVEQIIEKVSAHPALPKR